MENFKIRCVLPYYLAKRATSATRADDAFGYAVIDRTIYSMRD
jgi:hypothetical protein